MAKQYAAPPEMQIDVSKDYVATIETNRVALLSAICSRMPRPTTVNNFVFLARDGFYDGVKFHRVIA